MTDLALPPPGPKLTVSGFDIYPEALSAAEQAALLAEIADVVAAAPFYRPEMPRTGTPYSVRMTNCGPFGWVSTRTGYRYQRDHPETGQPWPAMPERLYALWDRFTAWPDPPEAALVNLYQDKAKVGLHVDDTEEDKAAPVLSISLGDTGVFRMGGPQRKGPTQSIRLSSGAIVVMAGPARLAYHGIDRILPGSSGLAAGAPFGGGRVNVTLRRVTQSSQGA